MTKENFQILEARMYPNYKGKKSNTIVDSLSKVFGELIFTNY